MNQTCRRVIVFVCCLVISAAFGCGEIDRVLVPARPQSVTILTVNPPGQNPLAAVVLHANSMNDSIRVLYKADDDIEAGSTPWHSPDSPVQVLGLKPGRRYAIWIEALRGGQRAGGPSSEYDVPPLPPAVAGLRIEVSGAFTGGYSLAPLPGADGHGYLVIFDSVGTIRWFRDFGRYPVSAASQQQNGHFTAYVGASNGFNPAAGRYVEVTPQGDSVRSISAPGGTYTDPHDLLQVFRPDGTSTSYLFGYELRNYELSPLGGLDGLLAIHQVLAIDGAGRVDTVFSGAEHWGSYESVEAPGLADLDHPNSIDLDGSGNLIVSYRDLNAIVAIDPRTKRIVWQLGGVRNQFTLIGDPMGGFDGQHDAHVLANSHLLIFDNGWLHSPRQSRAVEYAIDTDRMTATMVWQYAASPPIFNDFTGSAQRLANGNTLVAFTRNGIVDEVRPDGSLVARATITLASGAIGTPYRVTRINNLYSFAQP